ncbi:MAG: metal-dependent hydrolase, beta-lactamase superfamily [Firmicutes bacterium]|nr:metal-dependent hydrolase, beta-lactamase superfamily [Bacillota bacterium]
MEFKQIYTPGLAHCSYVIGGKNACFVIDPAREVAQYIAIANSWGLPIKGIIETHLHADFVSGHIELRERTGATIYISDKANAQFPHYAVHDEEEILLDTLLIKMLDTPGHTPESSVFLVSDLERGKEPALAFTGDTLMVGDAGRPDLFPDIKEELAAKLYRSLRRLEQLGDNIEMYPAHGAGSFCGKSLSSKLSSTIGTEKMHNPALLKHPEEAFIHNFLEGMPEAPDHFSHCSAINRKGAPAVSKLMKPVGYAPAEFLELSLAGYVVVDTRDQLAFGGAHIPGAFGLSLKGNFATFAGWVLPPDKPLLLVLEDKNDMPVVLKALYSVGLDHVAGYLEGGMLAYAASGLETARLESISVTEAKERYEKGEILLVDTRLKSEWELGHIQCTAHIPAPDVRKRYKDLIGNIPVAFICNTGNRSLLASSLMLNLSGIKNVINVIGGTTAWTNLGLPTVGTGDEPCELPVH